MWYVLNDGTGPALSYGFAPDTANHGNPFAPGQVYNNDSTNYTTTAYSQTVEITQAQYDAMQSFGGNPSASGFDMSYNGLTNSCIDFTWAAMNAGGLNPIGYEGSLWPLFNIPDVSIMLNGVAVANLFEDLVIQAINTGQAHLVDVTNELTKIYDRQIELNTGQNPSVPGSVLDFLATALKGVGIKLLNFLATVPGGDINPLVATQFTAATVARPRDPLVFELNGSSLETTVVNTTNPVYFDFTGNGLQSDTGWIGPDNAFLVLDANGSTTVTNGAQIVNTFADLSAIANGQSIINSSNPAFANLRLWVGSNGTPGSGQLVTLASLGITSINVASTTVNQTLANGNQVMGLGSFNYANGTTGTIADVNLVQNSFLSQFTTPLDTSALQSQFTNTLNTSSVAGLPDIQGSGQVRSLLEAATLSPTLVTLLQQYQATTSYSARLALVPAIIQAWSDTSAMAGTFTGAYAGDNLTVNIYHQTPGSSGYNAIADQLTILEHFNGRTFNAVPVATGVNVSVNLFNTTVPLLQQSYNALSASVFQSLELQTALAPYLNAISLTTTSTGISLNFSGLDALLAANQLSNPVTALSDLIELNQYAGSNLYANGWDGAALLQSWAQQAVSSGNTQLQAVLSSMNVELGSNLYTAGAANSILLGQGATETLAGGGGNDILIAGGGNDALNGGIGNNTYVFGIGSGQDTIVTGADATAGKLNTLQLTAGVTESNVVLTQVYDSTYGGNHALQISIAGNTADSITINGFFLNDDPGNANNGVQQISFTDGATWNLATIESMLFGAGSNYAPLIAAQVVAGLTASQVAGLNSQVTYLTAADMAALSTAQLAALTGLETQYFNSAQVAALGTTGVSALSTAALSGLSAAGGSGLSAAQIQALTPAQIAALSAASLRGLGAAAFAALTDSELSALTTTQIAGLNGTELAALDSTVIAALSAAQIAAITPYYIGSLTNVEIAELSTAQLAALTGSQAYYLTAAQVSALGTAGIAALSAAALSGLSPAGGAGLSAAQIQALTPAQIAALSPASLDYLSAAAFAALTDSERTALSAAQITGLNGAELASLDSTVISALSAAQIAAISPYYIGSLTTAEIAELSTTQLAALTASQAYYLTPAQVTALGTAGIVALSAAALGGLSAASGAGLSAAQIQALTPAQIAVLSPASLGNLSAAAFAALNSSELSALTSAQIGGLNGAELSALSSTVIALLSSTQIAAISPYYISALTTTQIAELSTAQLAALTGTQAYYLTSTQVSALGTAGIVALSTAALSGLSAVGGAGLTAAQIQALTPAQIAALSPASLNSLSAAAFAALTDGERSALSITQIADLNGAELATLDSTVIAALVVDLLIRARLSVMPAKVSFPISERKAVTP